MIQCEEAMDLICISLEEELNEEQKNALHEHLEKCPGCRDFRNTMVRLPEVLHDPEPFPEGLHAKIMESIDAEAKKGKVVSFSEEKRKHTWKWRQISVLAACLIFVLLFGFQSSVLMHRKSSTVQYAKSTAAEYGAGEASEETVEEMAAAAPAAAAVPEPAPTPYPTIAAEGSNSTADVKMFMNSDAVLAAGSEASAEEAEKEPLLLDELLSFLDGEPVISLAAAEITAADYTIPVILDGEVIELLLWKEEQGLSYAWDTANGWLYRSDHTINELFNFMDSISG
ncbi:MAG: zf-HC2 domain-containing protein [Oscillospiraceae bacterium]|nr:zf-HC2 domain-containing protein [Oscillospiraceae bacterium]